MNFARTNLRNPLACPSANARCSRGLVAPVQVARAVPLPRMPIAGAQRCAAGALATAAPAATGAPARESVAEQIGAGVMLLGFLVLALFG